MPNTTPANAVNGGPVVLLGSNAYRLSIGANLERRPRSAWPPGDWELAPAPSTEADKIEQERAEIALRVLYGDTGAAERVLNA